MQFLLFFILTLSMFNVATTLPTPRVDLGIYPLVKRNYPNYECPPERVNFGKALAHEPSYFSPIHPTDAQPWTHFSRREKESTLKHDDALPLSGRDALTPDLSLQPRTEDVADLPVPEPIYPFESSITSCITSCDITYGVCIVNKLPAQEAVIGNRLKKCKAAKAACYSKCEA